MKKTTTILLTVLFFAGLFLAGTATAQKKADKIVLMKTSMGDMKIKLYGETPLHQDNFIKLVNEKFYEGILFHRVIHGFMIQAGDPGSKNAPIEKRLGAGGPGYQIAAEINNKFIHKKGALSAARQGDRVNPQKKSSGSQFYIVHGEELTSKRLESIEQNGSRPKFTAEQKKAYLDLGGTPFLDTQYTVFGEVIEGMDVIDKIAIVDTNAGDRPLKDVKIISITIVE